MPQERYDALLELAGVGQYRAGMEAAAAALGVYENALTSAQKKQLGFALASGTAAAGIAAGLIKAVSAAGKMQQTEIAFRTLTGSVEAAKATIQELQTFAEQTPFSFQDVATGGQRLLGMGADARQLIPIMGALGNAISATGGSTDEFNRALYAVGQVLTNKTLQGDELRQLADAGIPLNELLAELGVTIGEVGKAGITSERFLAALIKIMNEGRFAGAMANQSKTLFGALSNLGDAANRLSNSIGQPLVEPLTKGVKLITDLTNALDKADPSVKALAATVGVALVGGLTAYSIGTVIAINRTIRLAEAHLAAAAATTAHANAQKNLNGAMAGQPGGGAPVGGGAGGKGGGGMWGGVKNFLGGAATFFGANYAEQQLNKWDTGRYGADAALKKVGTRAAQGAQIGSIGGPIGGLLGAVGGGIWGAIEQIGISGRSFFPGAPPDKDPKSTDPQQQMLDELRKANQLLQKQVDQKQVQAGGNFFPTGQASGAYAAMAGQNRRIIA